MVSRGKRSKIPAMTRRRKCVPASIENPHAARENGSTGPWKSDCITAANQGGLTNAYVPPTTACQSNTLASAAAGENAVFAAGSTTLSIDAQSAQALRQPQISRTIQHSGNIIKITYTSSTPISISHVAYLVPNAQPWCAS